MIRESLLLIKIYVFRMKILNRQSRLLKTNINFKQASSKSDNVDHRLINRKFFRDQEH